MKGGSSNNNFVEAVKTSGEPPIEPNHPSSLIVELLKQNHEFKDLIIDLVKDNREFKQLLIDQNKQIMEMAGNMGINGNKWGGINTFNININ